MKHQVRCSSQYEASSALQQEAGDSQVTPYAPQLQEQVAQAQAILIQQTNPEKILEEIILKLNGQIKNYDGTIKQIGEPLMNKKGTGKIVSEMILVMT